MGVTSAMREILTPAALDDPPAIPAPFSSVTVMRVLLNEAEMKTLPASACLLAAILFLLLLGLGCLLGRKYFFLEGAYCFSFASFGSGIGPGPLSSGRQISRMPRASIGTYCLQAGNISPDCPCQFPLGSIVFQFAGNFCNFLRGEIGNPFGGVDL